MIRVALYARYSSDNQRDASIEDQLRLCREYAKKQGWHVVEGYNDRAVSGASLIRPGIQALLTDASRGLFDVVLAEALDRISRDQEDVAGVYKRLTFAGIKIVTLSEGEITHLHVGLKGTMNALFLKDLADKTRRGIRGRVEQGKSGGGLCYGYRPVTKLDAKGEPIRGDRAINEGEAEIIRRIFHEFAAGKSPRAIVRDFNAKRVLGPHGGTWMDTTIRGHASRGTGILNNELYIGKLVWNRLRYVKNPDTGKRISRINPKSEWIIQDVPELRIVEDSVWEAAKCRQAALAIEFQESIQAVRKTFANRLNGQHRKRFLFSGLLSCGMCGGNYVVIQNDRYGCANHFRRGACKNGHTVKRDVIEMRIFDGLKKILVTPQAAEKAVRDFQVETNRLNHERRAAAEADKRTLERVERQIEKAVDTIVDGGKSPALLDRLGKLEREKAEASFRLANAPQDFPDVHPNMAEVYRAKIERLSEALEDPEAALEAAELIRSLVSKVSLLPGPKRGDVLATLHGDLAGILTLVGQKNKSLTGVRLSVVAGGGFEPPTFRL